MKTKEKILIGILFFIGVMWAASYVRPAQPYQNVVEKEEETVVEEVAPKEEVKVTIPSLPFPKNGTILEQHFISISEDKQAWIEVKTKGSQATVVKMVDSFSLSEVLVFFISPGETVEFTIPSGSYMIKVASGESWYGEDSLFGEGMSASRLDGLQVFEPGDYWTYELIEQVGGNLGQESINPEDF